MVLTVAIQMDAIDKIDIDGDSTFALALEAQARGHRLYYYLTRQMSMMDGRVYAMLRPLTVRREQGNHFTLGDEKVCDLAAMDVVMMRQDPPFDMSYITATHLLERIHPETLVVNDPAHVRNAPEKLFVTLFDGVMPPTLISSDEQEIKAFRKKHGDIIVKPLYGNGGAAVFRVRPDDENLNALLELFAENYREPIITQAYVPAVRQGDKRIILVDGEPVGALNRIPAEGESRSNLHVGGTPAKTQLTKREREICRIIGPELKKRGLIFAGIDVIGDYLTEINVTSPTGIQEIERFDGTNIAGLIWDVVEAKR
ncbi:MAG: glutathione synthase [Alphaproteobacteria bacterium]|nr:MAG: glutathione synthase [Alphaproteobacteria bacterium]